MACTRCGWDCCAESSSGAGNSRSRGGGVSGFQGGAAGTEGSKLSVHVGIGCGRVQCFHVGSDEMGWQLVVSGDLFQDQVRRVERKSELEIAYEYSTINIVFIIVL